MENLLPTLTTPATLPAPAGAADEARGQGADRAAEDPSQ
jgi:hypothetical protein